LGQIVRYFENWTRGLNVKVHKLAWRSLAVALDHNAND